jgi:hypothetical protein
MTENHFLRPKVSNKIQRFKQYGIYIVPQKSSWEKNTIKRDKISKDIKASRFDSSLKYARINLDNKKFVIRCLLQQLEQSPAPILLILSDLVGHHTVFDPNKTDIKKIINYWLGYGVTNSLLTVDEVSEEYRDKLILAIGLFTSLPASVLLKLAPIQESTALDKALAQGRSDLETYQEFVFKRMTRIQ